VSATVIKVKLLREGSRMPERATAGSSGIDLYACVGETGYLELNQDVTLVPTGLVIEAPQGYDLQIRPRSGLARRGVDVILGTLDSDYRGEVFVSMRTFGSLQSYRIQDGDRIAQVVVSRVESPVLVQVEELSESSRGAGGHGSTGR
jgi:dUTP pyrophosphatase